MDKHEEVLELIDQYKFKSNASKNVWIKQGVFGIINEQIKIFEEQVEMKLYDEIPYGRVYSNTLTKALKQGFIKKKDYVDLSNKIYALQGIKLKVEIKKNKEYLIEI